MKKIKCIIVDDEPIAREIIQTFILRDGRLICIESVTTFEEAIEVLYNQQIDVLFQDINLGSNKASGIDLIKKIPIQNKPKIIITTAYREFGVDGFELDVSDYLVKPISYNRFVIAINKVIYQLNTSNNNNKTIEETNTQKQYMFVKSENKNIKLMFDDIIYIEAMSEYIKIHTSNSKIIIYERMKQIEEILPIQYFIRIHKSYIVSIKAIEYIRGNKVSIGNKLIPIGDSYKSQIKNLLV